MSKLIAPTLRGWSGGDLAVVFAWAGVGFIVVTVPVAMFLRDPPDVPIARTAATSIPSLNLSGMFEPSSLDDLLSPRFALMWLVFFCNILAGISIISFQSPILQDLWRARDASLGPDQLASYGATLIAASSLFNGLGRFFWGALSDRIGRTAAFRWMLASQALVFALLTQVRNPWLFSALICHVLLCYGGGFGTMPSFVLDVFGKRKMATLYGAILTAWSAAGVAGPQLIAVLKDRYETDASMYAFLASAAVVGVGFLMSLAFPRPLPAVALAASESVGSGGSP